MNGAPAREEFHSPSPATCRRRGVQYSMYVCTVSKSGPPHVLSCTLQGTAACQLPDLVGGSPLAAAATAPPPRPAPTRGEPTFLAETAPARWPSSTPAYGASAPTQQLVLRLVRLLPLPQAATHSPRCCPCILCTASPPVLHPPPLLLSLFVAPAAPLWLNRHLHPTPPPPCRSNPTVAAPRRVGIGLGRCLCRPHRRNLCRCGFGLPQRLRCHHERGIVRCRPAVGCPARGDLPTPSPVSQLSWRLAAKRCPRGDGQACGRCRPTACCGAWGRMLVNLWEPASMSPRACWALAAGH